MIDAAAVIGAHGAIPATSNVAPAAAAEAWEAATTGDFERAGRAIDVVARFEELPDIARGGSAEGASFSSMKHVLHEWGVIDTTNLTRPLRSFSDEEVTELRARLAELPHGAHRVAIDRARHQAVTDVDRQSGAHAVQLLGQIGFGNVLRALAQHAPGQASHAVLV